VLLLRNLVAAERADNSAIRTRSSLAIPEGSKEREKSDPLRLSDRTGRFECYCNAIGLSKFDGASAELVRRKDCVRARWPMLSPGAAAGGALDLRG
jgi:hypothetical protein